MAKKFGKLPSEVLNLSDEYTSFCFNEACSFILARLESDEKPDYDKVRKKEKTEQKHYKNFKDMYKNFS